MTRTETKRQSHANSDTSLRGFLEEAAKRAEKIFHKHGKLNPIWHYVDRKGDHHVAPAPNTDKDTAVAIMRALFELLGVTRCVFMDEAYIVDRKIAPDMDKAVRAATTTGLANFPGRQEVLMFSAEDQTEGHLMARCYIERAPGGGKAKLGPLIIETEGVMEGRLVGVLPMRPGEKMQ